MAEREPVTIDEGSAFHALGLDDADDLVLRAELRAGWPRSSRNGASRSPGRQPDAHGPARVSALMNGKIARFSTDRLLQALSDLGQDVELRITPAKTAKGRLSVGA